MSPVDFWTVVLSGALALCAPIVIAGLGEIFLERTGGFNVGIEGMMLLGAVLGVLGSHLGGVWTGVLAGILAGLVLGLLMGVASALAKADIIIVGIAIGLLGTGLSVFLYQAINPAGHTNQTVQTQPPLHLPLIEPIPVIGPGLAGAGVFFYLSLVLVVLSWLVLDHTRFGLRLRAVGDDEAVARTRGIAPVRFRVVAAIIAGGFAGLAGATVPLAEIGTFSPGMTGGTGFIALAVVIIGRRTPAGLIAGALLFSFFNSLALLAQTQSLGLPVELFQALPYLATLFVLCVVSRRVWRRSRASRSVTSPLPSAAPEPEGVR
ncbi:ABC transporter permease [Leifsonia sp. 21MFCrub1.1]|uniref:ABC transporter permease n=1 Tax=Leifsonia sp. 21MFCrub1.1 TaxID=1798223 RepID=UPI0008929C68|nr:ABC transporter permease [Leifsonia sp. 21MFCrub1.1]SEB08188.1 nucleoside ABC transporter membrane protein [Leifsonia sp. 21MFCrub1.1]